MSSSKLMKMANPADLLPECSTIRSKLQKLVVPQDSLYLTNPNTERSSSRSKLEKTFRPKSSIGTADLYDYLNEYGMTNKDNALLNPIDNKETQKVRFVIYCISYSRNSRKETKKLVR